MLKRLELTDPKSCFNKASPDEPIFTLRAKDPIAAMAVRHWATMAYAAHEPGKLKDAMDLANAMDKWREHHLPPQPEVADRAA
jgi:hypothetical protein